MTAWDALLIALGAPVLAACAYLLWLTLLSWPRRAPAYGEPLLRFDVLVPAHQEEAGIAATVQNLSALDWPWALRRIVVVADNCTDGTAERARAAGATVWPRTDPTRRGKGFALEMAFARCLEEGFADAVVVVDADTVADPHLLRAFAARLEAGEAAVQAEYAVRNVDASWRTRLMAIAFATFHAVRSLGRERLGASCGLRGNGMCFGARALREVPHLAHSLVEDLEYGILLGRAGHRVAYAHEARVWGEMVAGERSSRSQRRRWEDGRRALARALTLPLLRDALRRRSGLLLDLAIDVALPPLSWIALGAAAGAAASFAFASSAGPLTAYLLGLGAVALYVLRGWSLSGTGAKGLLTLAAAPAFVAWKLLLLLRREGPRTAEWVRTARRGEQ